jgi:membrane protease subunit HflK
MYIETMERVLAGSSKVIVDQNGQGVVPYLPLDPLQGAPGQQPQGSQLQVNQPRTTPAVQQQTQQGVRR